MSRKKVSRKRKDCERRLLSKRDVGVLVRLLDGVDWCDEDSVFDLGVELGRWSVRLRSLVLERSVFDDD